MGILRVAALCLGAIVLAGCSSPAPTSPAPSASAGPSAAATVKPTASIPASPSAPPTASAPAASRTATPVAHGPAADCRAVVLAATIGYNGATGSVLGVVTVRNRGSAGCQLKGPPQAVRVRVVGQQRLSTVYSADPRPDPGADASVVAPSLVLAPGDSATFRFVWMNQCQARTAKLRVMVRIRDDPDSLGFDGPGQFGLPRCDASAEPATIEGFAWTRAEPQQP
jgi:hypothetical protein